MSENERIIRRLYEVAEKKDTAAFVALFTDEGYFYDVSADKKYFGADIGKTVDIYATAFPDMHRALEKLVEVRDTITVELSLNGTHAGPLVLPLGTLDPTYRQIHAPCCDVFVLKNGKIVSFHCYTAATILLGQLGVFDDLSAAFKTHA
jgi:ketosteroid isomerase-like protein